MFLLPSSPLIGSIFRRPGSVQGLQGAVQAWSSSSWSLKHALTLGYHCWRSAGHSGLLHCLAWRCHGSQHLFAQCPPMVCVVALHCSRDAWIFVTVVYQWWCIRLLQSLRMQGHGGWACCSWYFCLAGNTRSASRVLHFVPTWTFLEGPFKCLSKRMFDKSGDRLAVGLGIAFC